MCQRIKNYTSTVLFLVLLLYIKGEEEEFISRNTKEIHILTMCAHTPNSDFIIMKAESETKRVVVKGVHCFET